VSEPRQFSLLDEAETIGDTTTVEALTPGVDADTLEAINEASANASTEWVGLPAFVPVDDSLKVVVSVDDAADRDALLKLLGIATVHKGTRGTLSVWWPDRAREDLASLRFRSR
jgi:hypothetical protein